MLRRRRRAMVGRNGAKDHSPACVGLPTVISVALLSYCLQVAFPEDIGSRAPSATVQSNAAAAASGVGGAELRSVAQRP